VTSIDGSTIVARMQALSAEISSLGPALAQAAPSGEFASVLANANAVLTAAVDPAASTSSSAGPVTASATLLGLPASNVSGSGTGVTGASVVADAQQDLDVPYQ